MHRIKLSTACFLLLANYTLAQQQMKPLFNGKDLSGWYSFLRTSGKNNDPDSVFRVRDGLLHISGKDFGYISTENSYTNFHLAVEFKWGEKKYPPRENEKRDNGILYYVRAGETDKVWPKSIECQIQEGDVGDFWLVDNVSIWVDGKATVPRDYTRAEKKRDNEKPSGEWNLVEVIARDGNLSHLVNGQLVNEGKTTDLKEGKIMIQSEGAEIYYRRIAIAELD